MSTYAELPYLSTFYHSEPSINEKAISGGLYEKNLLFYTSVNRLVKTEETLNLFVLAQHHFDKENQTAGC